MIPSLRGALLTMVGVLLIVAAPAAAQVELPSELLPSDLATLVPSDLATLLPGGQSPTPEETTTPTEPTPTEGTLPAAEPEPAQFEQVEQVPTGGVDTGGGIPAWPVTASGGLALGGAAVWALRRFLLRS